MDKKHDFTLVDWYAKKAALAYESEEDIRHAIPNIIELTITSRNVLYFIENDEQLKRQIIVIRGTDNLQNIREDAEYIQAKNKKLGIWVHKGFDEDAVEILQAILPKLDKSKEIILTGHSLGAAISTLLMLYLQEEGFKLGLSINFGQPKFTNKHGVEKYAQLPLTRIVDENDLVPLLPPLDLIDAIHGGYEHLGDEIILLEGPYYVYLNTHQARETSLGSFWKNLGNESVNAHHMSHYQHNIQSKFQNASEVPFKDRKKYYDL